MKRCHFAVRFVVILALLPSGCGERGIPRGAVKGRVLLDGVPLQEGRINFEPTAGTKGPTSGTSIQDGTYEVDARSGPPVGINTIRINANKKSGRKVPSAFGGDKTDEIVEAIPPAYNSFSTLERKVEPGQNVFDFDLKSK